jgi:hypothetical protein
MSHVILVPSFFLDCENEGPNILQNIEKILKVFFKVCYPVVFQINNETYPVTQHAILEGWNH